LRSYATAVTSRNKLHATAVTGASKTVGKSTKHRLEAAKRERVEKAVVCVGNVASHYTVRDIREHCSSIGVHILFCYNISFEENGPRYFKLAVRATDIDVVMDSESWPSRVFVRKWRQKTPNTDLMDIINTEADSVVSSVSYSSQQLRQQMTQPQLQLQQQQQQHQMPQQLPQSADAIATAPLSATAVIIISSPNNVTNNDEQEMFEDADGVPAGLVEARASESDAVTDVFAANN
jgi:hypothetical protein